MEGEFGGNRAELTIFRVIGLGFVVVFLGAAITKKFQVGAGEDIVHDFLSLIRRVATFSLSCHCWRLPRGWCG
jgi:hypothetical protein